ncbi:hypothetical protein MLD38_006389 [Melastoma candidum]|uniref:Uncharacterized protein n=1 Tax=Melastoma candidum TaxID=119954 RepID=A0ACB9RMS7_9MYRT|nr:hypothetical protein MLD38_006389 [Melastoma candidum]
MISRQVIDLGVLWVVATFLPLASIGLASTGYVGEVKPGLEGAPMVWVDRDGLFLKSNDSTFALGLVATQDATLYYLAVVHVSTQVVVWSANRDSPISNSDKFVFGLDGNVFLQRGSSAVWSTDTAGKGVSSMELMDSGNVVLTRDDGSVVWQSFSHPTDTLLSDQEFVVGMKLASMGSNNLSYVLEMKSGNTVLYAAYETPQPYWSMGSDGRMVKNQAGGSVTKSALVANSWRFYDQSGSLLWQFIFSTNTDPNSTWIAVLGNDGGISFTLLQSDGTKSVAETKIPANSCSTPLPCNPYSVCYNNNMCRCVSALSSYQGGCTPRIASLPPGSSCQQDSYDLVNAGEPLGYFALGFLSPTSLTDLAGCKASCLSNCSCLVLFYQDSTRNCYLLNDVGAFQVADNTSSFSSFIKVSKGATGGSSSSNHITVVMIIVVATVIVILGMVYGGFRWYRSRRMQPPMSPPETSEEDTFLGSLGGMPIRFSYQDLQTATNNFSTKLGQGGFGSVFKGVLLDGTRLAVKKLEGIGQGKKEFRAEVCIIGSIHHHHLVRLKGFCAEGSHRLLAYEFMANGSLEKWIFKRGGEQDILDWETRFNIAVGTAKGLAYLHEDCDVKIVHCDIKPENVLLDENFVAKVSDFGLAKLMTREQSNVFTTLRGTRGYLAPEWLTNYAISEKSDVYSYGMLLLEIIGGRKNYDPSETSDRSHFPSYAFRMMEEGRLRDVLDLNLDFDEKDERIYTAIKVALWCIQEDMQMRPPMTRVVQMLEGLCHVPRPPVSSPLGGRLYGSFFKSTSEGGTTSSGPSDYNSDAHLSAVQLSGPR